VAETGEAVISQRGGVPAPASVREADPPGRELAVYATAPPGSGDGAAAFGEALATVSGWARDAGLRGLLIFTDNASMDPWAAAQFLIQRTDDLVPLVAVQPGYMHPFTAARMVSTIASLYGRRVDLNLVTGSYGPDLRALAPKIGHDERYERLLAYGQIIEALLRPGAESLTFQSRDYDVLNATIFPAMPEGLLPRTFVAGSSAPAFAVADRLGATRLTYPKALAEYENEPGALRGAGIRVGVIARETHDEAWRVATKRYRPDAASELFHRKVVQDIEAEWHQHLWRSSRAHRRPSSYWLYPFRTTREYCPYLVGDYDEVGAMMAAYMDLGVNTLILSLPREADDLHHAIEALRRAGVRHR
jgi:alkanesulfonate monooxygenase